jgi:hypothetical protein
VITNVAEPSPRQTVLLKDVIDPGCGAPPWAPGIPSLFLRSNAASKRVASGEPPADADYYGQHTPYRVIPGETPDVDRHSG